MQTLDPKIFGLPARTQLEQIDETTVALVMRRKSRIIMADGQKIVAKADKIRQYNPALTLMLKTSAPICSKTVQMLEQQGIVIESL